MGHQSQLGMQQGLDLALGDGVQVPAMTSIIHVTLGKAFNFPKPQFPHLSASKGCYEVEENVRVPEKVGYVNYGIQWAT